MDRIWANRLLAGTKAWEDVPERRREGVTKELTGRLQDGLITEERMNEIIGV